MACAGGDNGWRKQAEPSWLLRGGAHGVALLLDTQTSLAILAITATPPSPSLPPPSPLLPRSYLPFYGFLFVAYLIFTLGYAISACVQRAYLLKLQYMILAVIGFGVLEMAVWFFMYQSKNETGIPTPCNVCPTTTDYLVAVIMNVLKR